MHALFCVLTFCLQTVVMGFLLDNDGQAGSSGSYLTMAQFIDEKTLQHQEIEKLRHDMDQKMLLLATQLKAKIDNMCQCQSNDLEEKLNRTVEELVKLQEKNNVLEKTNIELKQKFDDINTLYHKMDDELTNGTVKINKNSAEVAVVKNETQKFSTELSTLKSLPNIQPLRDVTVLQRVVQNLSDQTQYLRQKDEARSQDFLALYNLTMEEKKHSNALDIKIENRLQKLEKSAEKVVLLAYVPSVVTVNPDDIIKFSNVKHSVGIGDIATYKRTGKFVCEKEGLYLVSATVLFDTAYSEFYIFVRGQMVTQSYKNEANNYWTSSTQVISLDLGVNDTVWVQAGLLRHKIDGYFYSILTIIKLK